MKVDRKEDGLNYAYRYRLVAKEDGRWRVINSHYSRKAIFQIYIEETQYAASNYEGLAVEVFIGDETWVVDDKWLDDFLDGNRHKITF